MGAGSGQRQIFLDGEAVKSNRGVAGRRNWTQAWPFAQQDRQTVIKKIIRASDDGEPQIAPRH